MVILLRIVIVRGVERLVERLVEVRKKRRKVVDRNIQPLVAHWSSYRWLLFWSIYCQSNSQQVLATFVQAPKNPNSLVRDHLVNCHAI